MSTPTLYIPPNSILSSDTTATKQRRVLLMGPPKSGKTYSTVTTFPNPFVLDFDRGLTEIKEPIQHLPLYSEEFFKKPGIVGQAKINYLTKFLKEEASKFTTDQTLVVDSLSTLCDMLAIDLERLSPADSKGVKDGFWFWKKWSEWLRDFCIALNGLTCHVVVCCHEQEIRDADSGRVIGYKWLLKGQDFSPRLSQFFTDTIRQTRITTDGPDKTVKVEYLWQIQPDGLFPLCATRMNTNKKFVPASFKSFNS